MRVKFTIAICALLVLGLAVSEVAAQGYRLAARVNTVVASGNNQELGALRLTYKATGSVHIPSNSSIEVTFGGLTITVSTTPLPPSQARLPRMRRSETSTTTTRIRKSRSR